MSARQLALDLAHRPALGEEDFLVAPCNAEAVAWIDRYPDWPAPVLAVSGPPGSGKTHLARVFMAKTGAVEVAPDDLPTAPAGFPLVIEDAGRIAGNAALEEAMFHLFNRANADGQRILLTAETPPARWPLGLADLASRLRTAPAPIIGAPDDALLNAVLVKLFADRQIAIGADVLDYVTPRIERSFAAARRFVADADRLALEGKRPITVPLARTALDG